MCLSLKNHLIRVTPQPNVTYCIHQSCTLVRFLILHCLFNLTSLFVLPQIQKLLPLK